MLTKSKPIMRRARCKRCDELFPADEVATTLGERLCSGCDETEYCNICNDRFWPDDFCRHIFESDGVLYGAGSGEADFADHKASFFAVLAKTNLSHEIRVGLVHRSIRTEYWGPCIGGGHYRFDIKHPGSDYATAYGDLFTDDLGYDEEMEMTIGVGWLDSLACDDRPQKAVDLTLEWLDEWETRRREHLELMWFHGTHSHVLRHRRTQSDTARAMAIIDGRMQPSYRVGLSDCRNYVGMVGPSCDPNKITVLSRDKIYRWGDGPDRTGSYSPSSSYGRGGFQIGFASYEDGLIKARVGPWHDVVFNRPVRHLTPLPAIVPTYEGDIRFDLLPEECE